MKRRNARRKATPPSGGALRVVLAALHGEVRGIVAEHLMLVLCVVMPLALTAPYGVILLVRYFYRVAATVTGPFP